jgi:thioesterase domain-containing protein
MAALAHSLDDEPIDPAEAPMSEADFQVIQRAHEICGHPPAVDVEQRAEQALTEARTLLQDLDAVEMADEPTDEVNPPVTDWKQAAQDAWDGESWKDAATDYRTKRGKQLAKVPAKANHGSHLSTVGRRR